MRQGEMFDKPRVYTRLQGEGYAATPGSGPQGSTCRDCAHRRTHNSSAGGRRWNKCDLVKRTWTRSTDIRLDAPACLLFVARAPEETN